MGPVPATLVSLAAAGDAYLLLALALSLAERRPAGGGRAPEEGPWPPVTVLKPLHGPEPDLDARLETFFRQDYPRWQVVFGVESPDDAALAAVERVRRRHPDVPVAVSHRALPVGGNPKMNNLAAMLPLAEHAVLVLSDADVAVAPDYLRRVAAALGRPGVGAATCLYRAAPADAGLMSRAMAAFLNACFLPSVRVGTWRRRSAYGLGATLALRRDTLERLGGLSPATDHLADDFALGRAVEGLGLRVAFAPADVVTHVAEGDAAALWRHLVRWMHATRVSRPWGYAGSIVTYPLVLSLLAAAAGGAPPALALAALAVAGRWALAAVHTPRGKRPPGPLLAAAVEIAAGAAWAAALVGRRLSWRGRAYRVGPGGRLVPLGAVPGPAQKRKRRRTPPPPRPPAASRP
jgi:ceramide glucosyltransferase